MGKTNDPNLDSPTIARANEIREEWAKELKRKFYSAGSTQECPVRGEPFDEGSSGFLWRTPENSVDSKSWVRLCIGAPPDYMREHAEGIGTDDTAFAFVHKDEHTDG